MYMGTVHDVLTVIMVQKRAPSLHTSKGSHAVDAATV